MQAIRKGGQILIDGKFTAGHVFLGCYLETPVAEAYEPLCVSRNSNGSLGASPFEYSGGNITIIGGNMVNLTYNTNIERIGTGNSKIRFKELDSQTRAKPIERRIEVTIPAIDNNAYPNQLSALQFQYHPAKGTSSLWRLQRYVDQIPGDATSRDDHYPPAFTDDGSNPVNYPNNLDRTWAFTNDNNLSVAALPFGWTDGGHLLGAGHFFFGTKAIANSRNYFTHQVLITNLIQAEIIFPEAAFPLSTAYTSQPIPWLFGANMSNFFFNFSIKLINKTGSAFDISKIGKINCGAYSVNDVDGTFNVVIIIPEKFSFPDNIEVILVAHFEKWKNWVNDGY
jgi:hypothetical protein